MNYYIYKIECSCMSYYGISSQTLYDRKSSHITTYRHFKSKNESGRLCASYQIFDNCDDWTIEIIECILTNNRTLFLYGA